MFDWWISNSNCNNQYFETNPQDKGEVRSRFDTGTCQQHSRHCRCKGDHRDHADTPKEHSLLRFIKQQHSRFAVSLLFYLLGRLTEYDVCEHRLCANQGLRTDESIFVWCWQRFSLREKDLIIRVIVVVVAFETCNIDNNKATKFQ